MSVNKKQFRRWSVILRRAPLIALTIMVILNCAGSRKITLAPAKTFDPDNKNIPAPKSLEENQIWDIIDFTFFYQVEKSLDLNWTFRQLGKLMSVSGGRQADNVNALDEVPNSSWYTNRHFHKRMSKEELTRGPNETNGPAQYGSWLITRGKFEGGTPGFTIEDGRGDQYIIKFDALNYPEMGSSAEVISTKILHACGYNVPQNSIVYVDPEILGIGETAQVLDQGVKRPMNRDDLAEMLKEMPRRPDGKIRVLASKFVDGKPVGIWNYIGTRKDDPNDLVRHEHRRELRGLRVISSWLNDADRRAANTLAVYTGESGNKFIKHFLIDMGSTLGSNNKFPHAPKYGNEYLVDPRSIGLSFITLGLYEKPWEFETGHINPRYPSVGYFESDIFEPNRWVPTYPNPAFENCTLRDAYWGAKIVMSFTDEVIRTVVQTASMSNPEAENYLVKTLIERRDKIGRYWFSRMPPLDKFRIERGNGKDQILLNFDDLAVEGHLTSAEQREYVFTLFYKNKSLGKAETVQEPSILLSEAGGGLIASVMDKKNIARETDKIFSAKIRVRREEDSLSKYVQVFFYYPGNAEQSRILGIIREE